MKLHPWAEVGRRRLVDVPVAATIGVFDGVHRGHQSLLEELVRPAGQGRGESLVVTFRASPKKVLNPAYPGDLMTWDEKVRALADAGVDHVVVIDFSASFSIMAGRDFFLGLKKSFVFSKLVLGWNFTFGKDSATTAADLGWLADPETRLTVLPPFVLDGTVVSSSAVRKAITEGDMARARTLLGRPYALPLEPPFRRDDGLWSVPRSAVGKLLPPPGTYPVRLDGRTTRLNLDEDLLSWESPPGLRFQEIVFE
jgi:riboflavin kinase/FMN adenylyltransferase